MQRLALVCAAVLSLPVLASAQESRASLGGRIIDSQGAVIPAAAVVVTSEDTGVKQNTATNDRGNWSVQFLLPGHYNISVAAAGFRNAERRGITLQTADSKLIDIELEIGAFNDTISVTADAPLIETTSATSGTVITLAEITEMPSMSRVTTLLATLSPGVVAQDQNQNVAHLWSYNAASQFTSDGGRNNIRSNEFELDGMPNVRDAGDVAFIPPPDSLQEFRVQMNAYDASIGRQAGSTIQMATKNGTATYHGSTYWFNQNNLLNANLFQTNLAGGSKPAVHFNEYGGTFGGPVWIPHLYGRKDKTFFFINFDGTRNADPRFNIRSVPTELERKGDFGQSYTTQNVGGVLTRFPIKIYDPRTATGATGQRTQFQNNVIDPVRLSNVAQKILAYVPLPNIPSDGTGNANNNYVPNSSRQNKMALLAIRGDQMWSNSHKSFATLRWYHEDELSDDDFHNVTTGAYQTRIPTGFGVDHVWTMNSRRVLDLRGNVTRFVDDNRDHGAGFDPAGLGLPASFIAEMERPSFPRINGIIGNIGANSAGNFTATTNTTWSAVMNHSAGNMMFKYGAEYWVLQRAAKDISTQGTFNFDNTNWTRPQATVGGGTGDGSRMAAFLLGLPNSGSFPRNANSFRTQHFYGLYLQDDWRVTTRLTLNLGLRWDYETPLVERFNRSTTVFDPTILNPISDAAQAAYGKVLASNSTNPLEQQLASMVPTSAFKVYGVQRFAGVNGQPRGQFNGDFKEYQPRFGFAYRLRPDTVIRGGVGRFTAASYENGGQNGFSRSTTLNATSDNFFTPVDTLDNPFLGGILAPTGSSLGPLTNLGQSVSWQNANPGRMHSWEYSLHIQQQYKSWLFEAGYTHNKTYGIYQDRNGNLTGFDLWKQLRAPRFDATGRPMDRLLWDELIPNPFQGLPNVTGSVSTNSTIAFNQFLRPVTILGDTTRNLNPEGRNRYDAMVLKAERRFKEGFGLIGAFTWSKLFEDTSFVGPEIAGHVEHKLGGEDRPLHLSIAPIWQVPVGHNRALGSSMPKLLDALAGGWELSGQYTVQSGVPVAFNATDSFFYDGKDFSLPKSQQSLDRWFDTSHFFRFPDRSCDATCLAAYPAWTGIQNLPGYSWQPTSTTDASRNGVYQDFGNYVRTIPTRWSDVRASNVNNLDAGIYKNFTVREKIKIQYRFEAFNTFNHPRFLAPNADPTSGSFGRVQKTQQNNARQIQMALKITF